jgi:exopolyphosphatase/guanosine-5'-triphosphate,3'-diphosphate pyrophosphatase
VPRFATIDVGSNSVLLHLAERQADGSLVALDDRAELTRLADGLDRSGRFADEAMDRTVQTLAEFVQLARQRGAAQIVAVGTAALRTAANATVLLERVQRGLGLAIEVISGEEEARLSFVAVQASLPLERRVVVCDIGGGSTELIFGSASEIDSRTSLPLGALTLTERFLPSDPVPAEELRRLRAAAEGALAAVSVSSGAGAQLVGMGGAVTTLAAVELGLEPYDPERVHGLYLGLTVAQRRALAGLHPRRADTILAGAAIARAVMAWLGLDRITVCDRGIRHGLLVDRFG